MCASAHDANSVCLCVYVHDRVCVCVCVSFVCTSLLLFYIITEKSSKHVHTKLTQVCFVCLYTIYMYVGICTLQLKK